MIEDFGHEGGASIVQTPFGGLRVAVRTRYGGEEWPVFADDEAEPLLAQQIQNLVEIFTILQVNQLLLVLLFLWGIGVLLLLGFVFPERLLLMLIAAADAAFQGCLLAQQLGCMYT